MLRMTKQGMLSTQRARNDRYVTEVQRNGTYEPLEESMGIEAAVACHSKWTWILDSEGGPGLR